MMMVVPVPTSYVVNNWLKYPPKKPEFKLQLPLPRSASNQYATGHSLSHLSMLGHFGEK